MGSCRKKRFGFLSKGSLVSKHLRNGCPCAACQDDSEPGWQDEQNMQPLFEKIYKKRTIFSGIGERNIVWETKSVLFSSQ